MSPFIPRKRFFLPGFTLVELLVVIGIIALLISILLPALSAVHRQAGAVKCAAALREIGNCYNLYSIEYKGYFPPAGTDTNYSITFNSVPNYEYNGIHRWPSFLTKYAQKTKIGNAAATSVKDAAASRVNSIFWGCGEFTPYPTTGVTGGVLLTQTGYGMNAYPEYTATFPAPAAPANDIVLFKPNAIAWVSSNDFWKTLAPVGGGTWYKQKAWTRAAERALVADARFWNLNVQACPLNGVIPGQCSASTNWSASDASNGGQTNYDFYRHGTYPKKIEADRFSPTGGKVAFNVLFADGHVTTLADRSEGYKAVRMRFPG